MAQKKYNTRGSIQFLLYAGQYFTSGATDEGSELSNMSGSQGARKILQPTSKISQGIRGARNVISVQICSLAKGAAANLSASPGVKAAAANLKK